MTLNLPSTFWLSALLTRLVMLAFLFTSGVGLMPDEAQYWTWSQLLNLGYYSKPPGIAWQIACGTHLFGSTELGVRCIALLIPIASALVIRKIVLSIVNDEDASWLSAIAFIISPLGFASSFLATTDGAMVLFALLSLLWYLKLWDQPSRYVAAGLFIAIGSLWKWMIFSLWIVLALELLIRRKNTLAFFGGVCLSLLGFVPGLLWNLSHDFATFRHVGGTLADIHDSLPSPNPLAFFLAGIAFITPGFFRLALPSIAIKDSKSRLLLLVIAVIWGGLFLVSFTRKMQGNWAVMAQTMFFPLIGIVLAHKARWHKRAYIVSASLAILLQTVVLATPYLGKPLLKISPLKQGLHGAQITAVLCQIGYRPECDFLFSDRYQTTSLLWFYGPSQSKAYFFNLHGLRQNQFSYWPGMKEECVGKNGFFVALFPDCDRGSIRCHVKKFRKELKPYFSQIQHATMHTLFSKTSVPQRLMIVIPCKGYTGKEPLAPYKF